MAGRAHATRTQSASDPADRAGIIAIRLLLGLLVVSAVAASVVATLGASGNAAARRTAAPATVPVVLPMAVPTTGPRTAATPSPVLATVPVAAAAEIARSAVDVPPPLTRTAPQTVVLSLETRELVGRLDEGQTYTYWTFEGTVPGPFLRVRTGDTVEFHLKNATGSTWPHSIDLHAVTGPGGGATATQTLPGKETSFRFKALNPGLYVYHCATAPIPHHVINGMYGLILVEPAGGLPKVDREYYVMQGELYTTTPFGAAGHHEFSNDKMLAEHADYVLFNGRVGALTGPGALKANVDERVRIYLGVGGFLSSSFHVIGEIFDRVYPEGAVGSEPLQNVQTTLIPAGGTAIVEFTVEVPGRYLLVDHSLPRALSKGAAGHLEVAGPANEAIFSGAGSGSGH